MIKYIEWISSAEKFNYLTNSVNLKIRKTNIINETLKNAFYSLCVYDDTKLIGYGRIIGDKAIFLYIQNIMVIPEYQNKHFGTGIIEKMLNFVGWNPESNHCGWLRGVRLKLTTFGLWEFN